MSLALLTVGLGGALAAALAVVRLKGEQKKTAELHAMALDLSKTLLATEAALKQEKVDRWDQVKRLEEVVAQHRRHYAELEKGLAACADPAALLARLRGLLG